MRLCILLGIIFISGCASSPYNYHVTPTPLTSTTKYYLGEVSLSLQNGVAATRQGVMDKLEANFQSEDDMETLFRERIGFHLGELQILSASKENGDPVINVAISYKRTGVWTGGGAGKPVIGFSSKVLDSEKNLLVSFSRSNTTTQYSYFKDIARNLKIAAGKSGQADENQDIDLYSRTIALDIKKLGK